MNTRVAAESSAANARPRVASPVRRRESGIVVTLWLTAQQSTDRPQHSPGVALVGVAASPRHALGRSWPVDGIRFGRHRPTVACREKSR